MMTTSPDRSEAAESPLPSFDQNVAVAAAGAEERSWSSHVEEVRAVRAATVTFFQGMLFDVG